MLDCALESLTAAACALAEDSLASFARDPLVLRAQCLAAEAACEKSRPSWDIAFIPPLFLLALRVMCGAASSSTRQLADIFEDACRVGAQVWQNNLG